MNAITPKGRDTAPSLAPGDLVAFVLDPGLRDALVSLFPDCMVHDGGTSVATAGLIGDAKVVLIELAADADALADIRSLRIACRRSTRIIGAGPVNDVTLLHQMMDAGASDYVVTPTRPEELASAIHRAARQATEQPSEVRPMRTVMITGARGGSGATMLATNLACYVADQLDRKVALIDLDLHFGTVALALDLEPSHGLRDILENPDRVDALFVRSALVQANDNLSVLAAEESLESPTRIRGAAFERLATALSDNVELLVIDAPCAVLMAEPELVEMTDELVVVSEMNLAAIRDILRIAAFARAAGFNRPLTIVGNKSVGKGPIEVDQKEFARGINQPVDFVLPYDPKTHCEAAKTGRSINDVAPKSALMTTIGAIAQRLASAEPKATKATFWNRIKIRA